MATRTISFVGGEPYHIYNRGNSKQPIYHHPSDYQRFFNLLYLSNTSENINTRNILRSASDVFSYELSKPLVQIHAICLMPNHYHLLVTPYTDESLSKFMLKLGTGYSMYFNTKHDRSGTLFEGRYKAKHVDSDEYLKYLFSYIHLNPVKKSERLSVKSFEIARNYPYSSLFLYLQHNLPRAALGIEKIIETDLLAMYLPKTNNVHSEILSWLEYESDSQDLFA